MLYCRVCLQYTVPGGTRRLVVHRQTHIRVGASLVKALINLKENGSDSESRLARQTQAMAE